MSLVVTVSCWKTRAGRHAASGLLLSLLSLALAACAATPPAVSRPPAVVTASTPPPAPPLPAKFRVEPTEFFLGAGDRLDVVVYGEPDLKLGDALVRPDGKLSFPLLGAVRARGRTPEQLGNVIARRLTRFVTAPAVTVHVRSLKSRRYSILGVVSKPGVFDLIRPVTVIEAIARSGGIPRETIDGQSVMAADLDKAILVRGQQLLPIDFPALLAGRAPTHNVRLRSGDYLYLPPRQVGEVYVLGKVKRPTAVKVTGPVPLFKALAAAGGLHEDALEGSIRIVRGSLRKPKVIQTRYKDTVKGKALVTMVRPGDVVYVPEHPLASASWILSKLVPGLREILFARALTGG